MNDIIEKEDIKIEDMIYEVRGIQVMLDSDLAKLYKCKNGTKTINLAVKRHMNRFPARFMFQLTDLESKNLRFQIETSSMEFAYGGRRYNPYVFTEQGVAMLSSVLRTEVAEEVSIKIMDAFVAMRHYIGNNEYRISSIESKIIEHDDEIKKLQESFNKFEEKKKVNEIYFNGQIFDAYSKIYEIFNSAKRELIIIDSYADNSLLDIVKRLNIDVTIITKKNSLLTLQDIDRYNMQYHNLKVKYDNTFHDRYFILDNSVVYHCGASINRIGYKTFSITLINDQDICNVLIKKVEGLK